MGAGILRAIGDSRRPFIFLVVAAVTNIVLDLLFVLGFKMGVRGVAWATILSQFASAILVVLCLLRTESCVHLSVKDLRIHKDMLGKMVKVGIPAALQMAITAFSNVFVQSYINQFGADCMSGWTAYAKIDQLIFMPMQSIALASTTFVGQNLGIGNVKRAKKGVNIAMLMAVTSTAILSAIIIAFAPQLVAFFNGKAEVVAYGARFLTTLTPFYVLCCANQIYSGALRGAGNSRAPMIIMLSSFVVFRQLYLFVVSNFIINEIIPLAMSYPAGWLLCSTLTTVYFYRTNMSKSRLVSDAEVKGGK